MKRTYNHKLKTINKTNKLNIILSFILCSIACISVAPTQNANARKSAGGEGDTMVYVARYDIDSCPLPNAIKAQYTSLLFCGLGKRAGDTLGDYSLITDGYSYTLPSVVTTRASVAVTLPCSSVATATKFTATSFIQTSPVAPPYRFSVRADKIIDTCL